MYKQTDSKYKNITMGNGVGSIYQYGCYLVSLCNGLNQKGYSFTPESLNDFFKTPDSWVGPYNNYIDLPNLHKYYPSIFNSFQQIDPWNDVPTGNSLISSNLVVIGRVSAVPIGGVGDHYVLITGFVNGICTIFDPWSGVEEPITKRWGKSGDIIGIRIFDVTPYTIQSVPQPVPTPPQDTWIITDQTKIPQIGNQEVQAINSQLNDLQRDLKNCQSQPLPTLSSYSTSELFSELTKRILGR